MFFVVSRFLTFALNENNYLLIGIVYKVKKDIRFNEKLIRLKDITCDFQHLGDV